MAVRERTLTRWTRLRGMHVNGDLTKLRRTHFAESTRLLSPARVKTYRSNKRAEHDVRQHAKRGPTHCSAGSGGFLACWAQHFRQLCGKQFCGALFAAPWQPPVHRVMRTTSTCRARVSPAAFLCKQLGHINETFMTRKGIELAYRRRTRWLNLSAVSVRVPIQATCSPNATAIRSERRNVCTLSQAKPSQLSRRSLLSASLSTPRGCAGQLSSAATHYCSSRQL